MPDSWRKIVVPVTGFSGARGEDNQIAQGEKLACIHAARFAERESHGHDFFVQRGVAGALAEAIDSDASGVSAGRERGDGVCCRHAKVVVSMEFQA